MVIVYIWRTHHNWALNHNVGHAALEINSYYGNAYVSFYPKNAVSTMERVKFSILPNGYYLVPSYYDDLERYGHSTNNESPIGINLYNLDEEKMLGRWDETKDSVNDYNLFDHNCSTVVRRLLLLGVKGTDSFLNDLERVARWSLSSHLGQKKTLLASFLANYVMGQAPDTPESVLALARILEKEVG